MKSYFRHFRHVRGWFCGHLFENVEAYLRLGYTLTSFYDTRFSDWLGVMIYRIPDSNVFYRALGLALTPNQLINTLMILNKTCCSQENYVTSLVAHFNTCINVKAYNRNHLRCEYQLLPQYL